MTERILGLVVCRRATDRLLPGYQGGFTCRVCGLPLQASPMGRRRIRDGHVPLCNQCGIAMTARLEHGRPGTVVKQYSPESATQPDQLKDYFELRLAEAMAELESKL